MNDLQQFVSRNAAGVESLMLRRCAGCRALHSPFIATCSSCRSEDFEWTDSSGFGAIVSWRLVHRNVEQGSSDVVPTLIAIVELDEGPWIYTTIEGDVPPISDEPVRVRFEPRPRTDRFPVYTVCPEPAPTEDDAQATTAIETTRPQAKPEYDSSWIRTALHDCDQLERAHCLDASAKSMLGFAVRWAPFGGATAAELLVTFGMSRRRFLRAVEEALRSARTDTDVVRRLKRQLKQSLSEAWRADLTALPVGG
ncbi:Zn-ribbon domain-containing OB-fold protein [Nocardia niigatensis]